MRIAKGTLVMAVDGSKMVVLANEGDVQRPRLQPILQWHADNPRSALQGTGKPGRAFSSTTPRRSSLQETDWHDQAKSRFAVAALQQLSEVRPEEDSSVILLASPSVLGDVRKHCSGPIKERIIAEIDKDVVNHKPDDIAKVIAAHEP